MTQFFSRKASPYLGYNFDVLFLGITRAGFTKVNGLSTKINTSDYPECGIEIKKLIENISFDDITLEKGLTVNQDFNNWAANTVKYVKQGITVPNGLRRELIIILKDRIGNPVKKWSVSKAFPRQYDVGEFNAMTSEVVIETLILACEEQKLIYNLGEVIE